MSVAAKQKALIEDLNLLPDPHERLGALHSYLGEVLLPQESRHDDLLVPGCVSRVWLAADQHDGQMSFRCAADSPMVAGLVALLCHLYSGEKALDVAETEPEVFEACGLTKVLSPTRLNGLRAVRERIKTFAAAQR